MNFLSKHSLTSKYQTLFNNSNINTTLRLAHFLGQANHESPGLKAGRENLNYSSQSLINNFGRHRISIADANRYGRNGGKPANQQMIANIIYGGNWGRINLGNTQSGDGWKYRGGGIFQITGRANYTKLSKDTGIDFVNKPELITNEADSLIAAIWYWNMRGLNKYADKDNVDAISDLINMGKLTAKYGDAFGFTHRRNEVIKYKKVFSC